MRLSYFIFGLLLWPILSQAVDLPIKSDWHSEEDSLKLENLKVADGFLYQNHQEIAIDVQLVGKGKRPLANHLYKIYSIDNRGQKDLIMTGRSGRYGNINLILEIPLHIKTLLVEREEKLPADKQYYFAFYKKDLLRIDLAEATASK